MYGRTMNGPWITGPGDAVCALPGDLSPEADAVLKVLRKNGREVIYGIYGNLR